jgi:hypothetical protein
MRIKDLTWHHHRVVAPLEAAEQKHWLAEAVANDWSVRELRAEIRRASRLPSK